MRVSPEDTINCMLLTKHITSHTVGTMCITTHGCLEVVCLHIQPCDGWANPAAQILVSRPFDYLLFQVVCGSVWDVVNNGWLVAKLQSKFKSE